MKPLSFILLLVLCLSVAPVTSVEESEIDLFTESADKHIVPTPEIQTVLSTSATSKSYISFAGLGDSFLFINGHFKSHVTGWNNVGNVYHALKDGDIVSIYARGTSRHYSGLIATAYVNSYQVSTGEGQWKAIGLSKRAWKYVRHWRTNIGSSCQWPAPITRPLRKSYAHQLRNFPSAAQVVWANGSSKRNIVLFRYVVGGEKCTYHQSSITFTANEAAWLYVDGKFYGSVSDWNQVKSVDARLTKGSVVALKARDNEGWYGVVADVTLGTGQHTVTGQPVWKAIRGYTKSERNPPNWKTNRYSSCQWPAAATIPTQPQRVTAKKFPYGNGARYVWADKVGERSVILLRYVVGGEQCAQQTKIYIRARAKSWLYINGRIVMYVRRGGRRTFYTHLQKGDVIGVLSKGRRRRGVLVTMEGPLGDAYSGGQGWKGRMGWGPRGWATSRYDSCDWRRARILENLRVRNEGKGRMIWGSRRRRGVSLVRYVVGGEECSPIEYESKGPARLYVNGRRVRGHRNGRRTWVVQTSLKEGDVVGIIGYATRRHGNGAVRAVVGAKGKYFATGTTEWRVSSLPRSRAWTRKGFDACGWGTGTVVGGLKRLRVTPVAAKAVWADGKATALRFVVGGDYCQSDEKHDQDEGTVRKAVVTLTGDNKASVFLNGRPIVSTKSWRSVAKAVVDVKSGDVMAVHAKDGGLWFGVRVGVVVDGKEVGTGIGDWRARSADGVGEEWKTAGFDGCSWEKVVDAEDVDSRFEHEAPRIEGTSKYVWASRSAAGQDMVGRLVLGHTC